MSIFAVSTETQPRRMTGGAALLTIVMLGLLLLPWIAGSYYQGIAIKMMIFGLFGASLNLVLGYAGLASLGHAAFFGVGGYTVAKLAVSGFPSFWLQLGLAGLLAMLTAALFSLMTLRARGAYLLMITLALAQVLWGVAYSWKEVTGADDGIPGVTRPSGDFIWNLSTDLGFYNFVLLAFSLAIFAFWVLVRSPFGRVLIGIRENERRMVVLGYNVWLYKYVACILSGLVAGIAGALLVWQNGFVGPSYLSISLSATALIMVILGGAGTVIGPVLGAFIIVGLENYVSGVTDRWLFVLGLIYVLVTLFAPHGLIGLLSRNAGERE
jgi:branched-chain amino acid transport system permease protein